MSCLVLIFFTLSFFVVSFIIQRPLVLSLRQSWYKFRYRTLIEFLLVWFSFFTFFIDVFMLLRLLVNGLYLLHLTHF